MEAWQTVLVAFGGNAALLAMLAYLAKSLLERLLVRDSKLFESDLKSKTDIQIERLKSEISTSLESYKVRLKKSEVFFLRELDAASAFSSLFHSISPGVNHPDMDWFEACNRIAEDFGVVEKRLNQFQELHSAMLNEDERQLLVNAISTAAYGKFQILDAEISHEANEMANGLYKNLKALETQLLARVRAQASL